MICYNLDVAVSYAMTRTVDVIIEIVIFKCVLFRASNFAEIYSIIAQGLGIPRDICANNIIEYISCGISYEFVRFFF